MDTPLEDRVDELSRLIRQLIADQRNIHRGKDSPNPVSMPDDFLLPEPKDEDDDQPEQPVLPDTMAAFGARQRNMLLVMGHGSTLPSAALSAFFPQTGDAQ